MVRILKNNLMLISLKIVFKCSIKNYISTAFHNIFINFFGNDIMENFENQKFCQSCAMPMTEELFGTNADGSKNEDYCIYCFKDGEFTSDMTMEEMMNFCIEKMVEVHPEIDKSEASKMMNEVFPQLKRWSKD